MDDPAALLERLAGTRYEPIAFASSSRAAVLGGPAGHEVLLEVDGPTIVASVSVRTAPTAAALDGCAELVAIDDGPPLRLRCWARHPSAGDVAVAVRTVVRVGDVLVDPPEGADASDEVPEGPDAAAVVVAVLDELVDAGAPALAADLEALVRGEREQVLLDRVQLDELVGLVLGGVTLFGIGAAGGGGVTLNLVLASGRAVDVEVEVGSTGTRLEPHEEATEVAAALAVVREVLAGEGRRLARLGAAGDGIVVATSPVDD